MSAIPKLTPHQLRPPLTTAQVTDFFEKGYFVLPGLFHAQEVQEILEAFDRLQAVAKQLRSTQVYKGTQFVVEGDRIDRIVWMGAMEPRLLEFSADPRYLAPASQLLYSLTMDQLICQGHYKLPGDSVKFDWHQDSQHRGFGTPDWEDLNGRGSYVQTLMALDEIDLDNGPVIFVPYTTHWGHIGLENVADPSQFFDTQEPVPVPMKPGDVAFFHPYSIHGSVPNRSSKPRRVFINGYAYPGANKKQYPGEGSGRRLTYSP
jgi:ectoine hydroxylase-related dioxygenase (phytanoyl-CoA dioxygenase family)